MQNRCIGSAAHRIYLMLQMIEKAFDNPQWSRFLNKEVLQRFRNFGGVSGIDCTIKRLCSPDFSTLAFMHLQ